ncbi:MAG: hypothetical protein ACRDYB_15915, partial [Acidimicrobiales bacterium]
SVAWYDHPSRWPVELTATGPAAWQRVTKGETPQRVPVPAAGVSAIKQSGGSISFHVRRLGTPVLVKTSYFPDWQARGASGPWRATPNLMVVIPTSHTVTLTYGSDGIDNLGLIVSGLALVALLAGVVVRRRRPGHHGARAPDPGRPRVRPPGRADGPGRS